MTSFNPIELRTLSHFPKYGAFREGKVIPIKNIFQRARFSLTDLFSKENDLVAFNRFYERIRAHIETLDTKVEGAPNSEVFEELKLHLHIGASLSISRWGKNLEKKSQSYTLYQAQLKNLQAKSVEKARVWSQELDPTSAAGITRDRIVRWIEANPQQLQCAALLNLENVPFRYEELPVGTVVLTNPTTYLMNANIRHNLQTLLQSILFKIKALICWILTGKRNSHAALSLSEGRLFDLSKNGSFTFSGIGKILEKGGRVCYHDVVIPNKVLMLEAYNQRFPAARISSFEELWHRIENDVLENGVHLEASLGDVFKVYLSKRRGADYDGTSDWNPRSKRLVCSAGIAAVFAKYGIDVGKEFGKTNQQITPADFFSSSFFNHPFGSKP